MSPRWRVPGKSAAASMARIGHHLYGKVWVMGREHGDRALSGTTCGCGGLECTRSVRAGPPGGQASYSESPEGDVPPEEECGEGRIPDGFVQVLTA